MPVYRYEHSCGYKHDQFLKADVNSIILKCERCGGSVSARQIRDKSVRTAENNEVVGILRDERSN